MYVDQLLDLILNARPPRFGSYIQNSPYPLFYGIRIQGLPDCENLASESGNYVVEKLGQTLADFATAFDSPDLMLETCVRAWQELIEFADEALFPPSFKSAHPDQCDPDLPNEIAGLAAKLHYCTASWSKLSRENRDELRIDDVAC